MNDHLSRCSSCKYWSRFTYDQFEDDDGSIAIEVDLNIGACSKLDNDLNYFEDIYIAQSKIKDSMIGCENLYTHENFGCIHHSDYQSDSDSTV